MTRIEHPVQSDQPAAAPARWGAASAPARSPSSLLDVTTLILWSGCLMVGLAGLLFGYPRLLPAAEPAPLQAELLNVELTSEPLPPLDVPAPPKVPVDAPPPVPEKQPIPAALPLMAVSAAEAAVAFAVPVEGPVQIVPAEAAPALTRVESRATSEPAPTAPVQALTFGVGEGRQPAPDYPRAALREGQEGTVRVRFSIGPHGRVLTAEAASPCPWPLLNESATRVVRERWRFRPGASRLLEVSIRFELRK